MRLGKVAGGNESRPEETTAADRSVRGSTAALIVTSRFLTPTWRASMNAFMGLTVLAKALSSSPVRSCFISAASESTRRVRAGALRLLLIAVRYSVIFGIGIDFKSTFLDTGSDSDPDPVKKRISTFCYETVNNTMEVLNEPS